MRWEYVSKRSGSWFCLQPMRASTSLYAKAEDAESQYRIIFLGAKVMYQICCPKLLLDLSPSALMKCDCLLCCPWSLKKTYLVKIYGRKSYSCSWQIVPFVFSYSGDVFGCHILCRSNRNVKVGFAQLCSLFPVPVFMLISSNEHCRQ